MNMLIKTIKLITAFGEDDRITYVGTGLPNVSCDWSTFKELAEKEFGDSKTLQDLNPSLRITSSDGWTTYINTTEEFNRWIITDSFTPPTETGRLTTLKKVTNNE